MERINLFLIGALCCVQGLLTSMEQRANSYDAINKKCYDNCADRWDRFPFMAEIPKMVREGYDPSLGNQALDIGSGTGVLAAWMRDRGFDVTCIDPSDEMVKRCREKGLKTVQARIQDYSTQDKFAAVLAVLSLIHVPKKEMPHEIEKIASWLPQGGLLIVAMIGGKGEGVEGGSVFGYPRFFAKYDLKELRGLFASDFELKEAKTFDGGVQYHLLSLKRK